MKKGKKKQLKNVKKAKYVFLQFAYEVHIFRVVSLGSKSTLITSTHMDTF